MALSRRSLAAVLVAGMLTAACGGESPSPTQRPLIDPEPLWSGHTVPSQRLRAEFHGTVLLVYGAAPDEVHRGLLVVEPESGKPLWRLDNNGPLPNGQATFDPSPARPPLAVGDAVLVPYRDGATVGIAALASAGGRIRWQRPIEGAPWHLLLAAGDDLAVSVTPPDCCTVNDPALIPIVATDLSTGQTRWRATGSWPRFVHSGTVLGVRANSVDAAMSTEQVADGQSVVGLDAATGAPRWDLAERYDGSNLMTALNDVAAVKTGVLGAEGRLDQADTVVIDTNTGRELANLGDTKECVSDQHRLIACRTTALDQIVVFDTNAKKAWSHRLDGGPATLYGAWRGHLFLEERVVDSTGKLIETIPSGSVVAMSDTYAVVQATDGDTFAVHRRAE